MKLQRVFAFLLTSVIILTSATIVSAATPTKIGTFTIRNKYNSQYLDYSEGDYKVVAKPAATAGILGQDWVLYRGDDGSYEIRTATGSTGSTGEWPLGAYPTGTDQVVIWNTDDTSPGNNIKWIIQKQGAAANEYIIKSFIDTNKVMAPSATNINGASLILSDPAKAGTPGTWIIAGLTGITLPTAKAPVAAPLAGSVPKDTTVTLTSPDGLTIYYTEDGSDPKTSPTAKIYSTTTPITISKTPMQIRAYASGLGYIDSPELNANYTISAKAAQPVSNVANGQVTPGRQVTLSCSTNGSAIYYTTDGSTPTAASQLYTSPIVITTGVTIKAIAIAPSYTNSDVSTFTFSVVSGATPTPTPGVTNPLNPLTPNVTVIKMNVGAVQYTKNGQRMFFDVAPYIDAQAARTMVPIRFIAEGIGATVNWVDAEKTDYITLNGKTLSITVNKALPNQMGTAVIKTDRLFVPIRYISEQLGATVEWDAATLGITITFVNIVPR